MLYYTLEEDMYADEFQRGIYRKLVVELDYLEVEQLCDLIKECQERVDMSGIGCSDPRIVQVKPK